ncbi:hypothetical protein, partial [Oscillibacter sp.]|uniref:hypothetical protein n=1 Tax=Oscillibacter sp. TaxID=1945593 RepID=UPI002D7F8DB5
MFDFLHAIFSLGTVRAVLAFFEVFFIIYLVGYASFLFISVVVGGAGIWEGPRRRGGGREGLGE